jgi:hypothetical protein
MKEANIALPKLGAIAVTRVLLGVGIGLLLSEKIGRERRAIIGGILAALGAVSTIPLAIGVVKQVRAAKPNGQPKPMQAPMA